MDKSHSSIDSEQIKVMAHVLSKMGKFFSQMAEQCLGQLSEQDALIERHKLQINREKLNIFENTKKFDKSKIKEIEDEEMKKNLNMLQNVKCHKPKHPVSSFFFFYREKGQQIAKERGEVLGSKIAKIVGELWQNMSETQREPYEIKSKVTRQKYEEEMMEYRLKYADEIVALKKYKQQMRTKKKFKSIPTEKLQKLVSKIPQKTEVAITQTKKIIREIPSSSDGEVNEEDDFDDMDMSDPLSDSMQGDSSLSEQLPALELSNSHIQPNTNQQIPKLAIEGKKDLKDMSLNDMSLDDLLYNEDEQMLNLGQFKVDINSNQMEIDEREDQSMEESAEIGWKIESTNLMKNPNVETTKPLRVVQPIKLKTKPPPKDEIEFNSQSAEIDHLDETQAPQQAVIKPKGPISSFILFYRAKGKEISEANKLPLGPKVIKIASEIWHKLPTEQKEFYAKGAKQIRENYYKEIADLKSKYGDDVFNKQKSQKWTKKMKNKK